MAGEKAKIRLSRARVLLTIKSPRIEKETRENDLSSDDLYQIRQKDSKPILDDFKQWLLKTSLRTPPKGLLGKAVAYTLNQWDRFVWYLEDGRLPIRQQHGRECRKAFCGRTEEQALFRNTRGSRDQCSPIRANLRREIGLYSHL